jgi:coiled-coil domain-containing protein 55
MTFKFGLNLPKKAEPARPKPANPLFGGEDDSSADEQSPKSSRQYGNLSSKLAAEKHAEEAQEIDPSIFDYDAAYDAIHAQDAAKKAAHKAAAAERKSRYMDGLLASADVRKRDQLRYREKVLQREREAEGEDFADKEKFVTGAYKQQQEEVRRMEEEEKRKEEEEARKKKTMGMAGFYKNIMEEKEKRYQENLAAAAEAEKKGFKLREDEPKQKSDVDLARELNAKGADIAINEEGQLVDERQLLKGGLNVVAKPTKPTSTGHAARPSPSSQPSWQQNRTANQRAMRERQTRMLEAQLEQSAKRAADEESEKQRELEHKTKSKKTDTDVSSARERYLQRKREAEAAKAAAKDAGS